MSSNLPATEPPPSFVRAMGDAADAAIRQGISATDAIARAAFAIDASYAWAGLPTSMPFMDRKERDDDPQS